MQNEPYNTERYYPSYNDLTDPGIGSITAPILVQYLPRQSGFQRFLHGVGRFFVAIIRKINQLLSIIRVALVLFLLTRFLLILFGLMASPFAYWVYTLSAPLIFPFNHLAPMLHYNGYLIDLSTAIAIVVYSVAISIVRRFFKLLITRSPY